MRFQRFITEEDDADLVKKVPEPDKAPPEKEEKTPEQEAEEQRQKDLEKIVDGVKLATDKNKMNNMVKMAAALSKDYGKGWLADLKKMLSAEIVPETVDKFMKYTENFSEKLTHIKEPGK